MCRDEEIIPIRAKAQNTHYLTGTYKTSHSASQDKRGKNARKKCEYRAQKTT